MHCILHIGPTKTGSSSIQFFLREHLDDLRDAGFFIPKTQRLNMAEFQIIARSVEAPSRATLRLGLTGDRDVVRRAELQADMAAQFAAAKSAGFHTAIVSNEGLAWIGDAVANVQGFLAPFCDSFTVVPVLRRQDLRTVSQYKNLVKNWVATEQDCLAPNDKGEIGSFFVSWERVFGVDAIRPILFPDSVDEPRDLIADFCAIAGIKGLYDPSTAARYHTNTAIDGRAIEVLRQLNVLVPDRPRGDVPWGLKLLEQKLETAFAPPLQKVRPARRDVVAFMAHFEAENEAVHARYFPERVRLFSDDYSRYPEEAVYPTPSPEEVMALLGDMVFDKRLAKSRAAERKGKAKK